MLRELHISGLGVIDDLDLELHPGLNVLTGETGTGKTMVTVGLQLALGRRGSASMVRAGASAARVQARFDAPQEAMEAGWAEDGEVVLARSVSADGRSTARIGGQLTPVSALAGLSAQLVEIHGQHEGQRLLTPAAQTLFVDRFAGADHLGAVARLREEHEMLRAGGSALAELESRERDREREMDLLAYQVREIETTAPLPDESAGLRREEARLAHAERLLERASAAEQALGADGGGSDELRAASGELRSAGELDPDAADLAARAADLAATAVELAREVREYRERLELDPARLEEVRERIAALAALQRKYGEGEGEVLAFLERARIALAGLAGAGEERDRLEREVERRSERAAALAVAVSDGRAWAARGLGSALEDELRELGMAGASIEATLVPNATVTSGGAERVELVFSGGPGQPALPLAKVASGGELSRTMLACRSVLVDLDEVPTLIFDEVDAGIGGEAGVSVGRRLARLAARRQVVVVTHLPQIASFADRHVRVRKVGGTAAADVLDDSARVEELSRMLAGLPDSDAAAAHAEELLVEAGRAKHASAKGRRSDTAPRAR
ncbi:MAG: DNA repair protein RecN [Actinobacteria bacterium]|nr:DNA repair protein RecN [Actinomycetota bacterium]